mgnify:CR=1 FL=1
MNHSYVSGSGLLGHVIAMVMVVDVVMVVIFSHGHGHGRGCGRGRRQGRSPSCGRPRLSVARAYRRCPRGSCRHTQYSARRPSATGGLIRLVVLVGHPEYEVGRRAGRGTEEAFRPLCCF